MITDWQLHVYLQLAVCFSSLVSAPALNYVLQNYIHKSYCYKAFSGEELT
jgi:hypothetical protein